MMADRTWNANWRWPRAAIFSLLISFSGASLGARPQAVREALQSIGSQIKLLVDRTDRGVTADSSQLMLFEQALGRIAATPEAQTDVTLRAKLGAVTALLSRLRSQVHAPGTEATPTTTTVLSGETGKVARARIDLEIVRQGHGDRCETALGVSVKLPVQVALATAGTAGSGAWLHFFPTAGAHYRFATDSSSGVDPALEVFSGCGARARRLAANDDTIGLDAAATVDAESTDPLFVHVSNTAAAGRLVLSVADSNGSISGTVRDAASGLPLANVTIELFNIYGGYVGYSTKTDASGHYSAQAFPDDYYVRAAASDPYLDALYPAAPCNYGYAYSIQNCDLGAAQQVAVASDTTTTGVDISMTSGFHLAGTLRDASNQPLPGSVTIFEGAGNLIAQFYTDSFGRFSVGPFLPATYEASAAADGYGQQVFDGVACTGPLQQNCDTAQATPIVVADEDVVGLNFELPRLATISGTVTSGGAAPASGFTIVLLDQYGNFVSSSYYYYTPNYDYGPVAPGTYYVYASASGYYSQLLGGIDCGRDCAYSIGQATTLTIDHAGQTVEADFDLEPLPKVHGHVQDSVSGLPLSNVQVAASPTPPGNFQAVSSVMTDAAGDYAFSAILPGSYYLWAQSNDHIDAVYPDIECESFQYYYYNAPCDVTGAVLLTIAPGQVPPAFDFSLLQSSSIRGSAFTRIEPGADLPAAQVEIDIYDGAGSVVGSANVDLQGNYAAIDLPSGSYFAATSQYMYSYVPQIWQNIDCPSGCAPTTGTAIPVPAAGNADGIDFVLLRRDAIVGRVTDTFGMPVAGVIVDLFSSSSTAYAGAGISDGNGYYAAAGSTGSTYFVATEAGPAFVDQVYSGIDCVNGTAYFGLCPFSNATAVPLSYAAVQPQRVDFQLKSSDPIFANGFEVP